MALSVSWTKSWSNSDNGTILYGVDLGNIQSDIQSALANGASLSSVNTWTTLQTFSAGVKPSYIILPVQSAGPTTASDQGGLYVKTASSVDELFYRMESNGTEVQMTKNGIVNGRIVQYQMGVVNSVVTCSTALPQDNSIPQNTEGNEVVTVAITPTDAANILVITCHAPYANSSTGFAGGAIFQDSTAAAIAAAAAGSSTTNEPSNFSIAFKMVAGTTSATTFKLRMGATSGTVYVNGQGGTPSSRAYGGVDIASISVMEVKV